MKKAFKIVNIIVFFGIIAVLSAFSLLRRPAEYSELENRYLSAMPKLSASEYFSKGYTQSLSKYLDDRFLMRTNFISLHTRLELLQGRKEVNGIVILDDRMVEPIFDVDYSNVEQSISAINEFSREFDAKTYVLIVPTSAEIYSDRISTYKNAVSQKEFIDKCYAGLDKSIVTVKVLDTLAAAKDDYIYYRTDHHWTQYGAYLAYAVTARRMGIAPSGLERFNVMHASHSFLGSMHSRTLYSGIEEDTIDFYISNYRTVSKSQRDKNGVDGFENVYLQENLLKKDKYLSYLGENTAKITLTSSAPSGKLLVIKDSYANCFVPFMAEHYATVDVIDPRYITDINNYVTERDYDAVLFLYNAKNFSEDNNLRKLKALKHYEQQ